MGNIEERTYGLMGSFVKTYENRIKPLLNQRNFTGVNILITSQCLNECALRLEDNFENSEGRTGLAGKVDGYGNYIITINLLMSLGVCPGDEERTERIKRVDYNIQELDKLLKDNIFYQKQRGVAA